MSKNNPFSSFADIAEKEPDTAPITLEAKKKITLQELADFLNNLLKTNPESGTATVFRTEGTMSIEKAILVEFEKNRLIIG